MKEQDLIETSITTSRRWLHELVEKLQLPEDDAGRGLHALRAGLHAIRDRLPTAEAVHLGAQLPTLVRGIYYDGFRLTNDESRIRSRAEMIQRVQRELEPDKRLSAPAVLHAVIDSLAYWPGPDEFWPQLGTTIDEQLARYHAVIHLRTPPPGEYNQRNPLRVETPEQAHAIDQRIALAWARHPRRFEIPATHDFMAKARRAVDIVRAELPDCCPR